MQLHNKHILITGATGGIGSCLARKLITKQARLSITGRNPELLSQLRTDLDKFGADISIVAADLTRSDEMLEMYREVSEHHGDIDILINNAGGLVVSEFAQQDQTSIDRIIATNISAPQKLTQLVLPGMVSRGNGKIVNIGSVFGSIAFPCYTTYSASKFALRGFSQGLRRELMDTGVSVTYIAPRAVRTALNPKVLYSMSDKLGMTFDEPDHVADHIVRAIEKDRNEYFIGFPESLFVYINALVPGLVDLALAKQARMLKELTRQN